jgi:glycosyltransferase involved in cell wall biosynthesis
MYPLLSICVATKNRSTYLNELLTSIIRNGDSSIEVVILDSSSNNETHDLIDNFNSQLPIFKYIKNEKLNLDQGYDEAIKKSSGEFCWLLPDDDTIKEEAISSIKKNLLKDYDLVLLNLECFDKSMKIDLNQRLKYSHSDLEFSNKNINSFLDEMGILLSYAGSVVIRRSIWTSIQREKYYGSWFVHVGVILESNEIQKILFMSEPLIRYRSGNSSWTPKSFEIWYLKWPNLIWSFGNFESNVKMKIAPIKSWRNFSKILKSRAMGEFNFTIYKKFILRDSSFFDKTWLFLISIFPASILNISSTIYCSLFRRRSLYTIYNLRVSSDLKKIHSVIAKILRIRL